MLRNVKRIRNGSSIQKEYIGIQFFFLRLLGRAAESLDEASQMTFQENPLLIRPRGREPLCSHSAAAAQLLGFDQLLGKFKVPCCYP